ncbi:dynamin family protein [Microbacter margulisiae]|uniref:GTP-binding protein EngB required for normal cell division n=1 Tax=Microbacter margulisiae TaxID=1350067 RepID=A0A7W5H1E0_9PORP|nr:dynamin family protein [Microbacter margulisiae]MBB3187488.1 GTP-binding protein EngB required for normal cell division [Microbacter margulisiae]
MQDYTILLTEIKRINVLTGAPDLTRPLEALLNDKRRKINVAVLGQFKTGKSSLINSLLQNDILPVGVVPLTAIVTQILYDHEPSVHIQFIDGTELNTTLDHLATYVTEKHNPNNERKVAQAEVFHPALEPFSNISFVDTPGLGSFYKHNSDTTLEWLPFTGLAIAVISAERPLSEEDITLLKGIATYCPDLVIVVTKTDLFGSKELQEIRQYINASVSKSLQRDIEVLEYSTITQTDQQRKSILEQVITPLHDKIDQKREEIMLFKFKAAIRQSIVYADLALQASLKRLAEKNQITKTLQEMERNHHHHEKEMMLSTSSFKGEIREKLETIIISCLQEMEHNLQITFEHDFQYFRGTLFNVSKQFEQWLAKNIRKELLKIDESYYDQINQLVMEYLDYYRYTAVQFRQQLEEKLTESFGIHLSETYWQCDFMGVEKPDVSIYRVFDSHLDSLLFFLPIKGFSRLFYNHFKKQIPLEAEKNLHRYISFVTTKIFQSIDALHAQAVTYIKSEMTIIINILTRETGNNEELTESLGKLKTMQADVETNAIK